MQYVNIKNPFDINKRPWIKLREGSSVSNINNDVGGLWSALQRENIVLDAGLIQEALKALGLKISHNPEHIPNGITISSAGILICLEEDITRAEEQKLIAELTKVAQKPTEYKTRASEIPDQGESMRHERGGGSIS